MDSLNALKKVVKNGLCTHCGTCIALSEGKLGVSYDDEGIIPRFSHATVLDDLLYEACPGKGLNYPELFNHTFGKISEEWLLGPTKGQFIAHSNQENIRRLGASAGIITHVLVYLLDKGLIKGAVVSRISMDKPWVGESFIAKTKDEILDSAQSIYQPVPVNLMLQEIEKFKGKLAFVGLPDHVAAIRYLQKREHPWVKNIHYIFGPYVGINMTVGAIRSFLRSNGVKELSSIQKLNYRAGEWPGYLKILLKDGKILKAEKFYYNYLLPFYATRNSLFSVDFSNELTDLSVGDAWHPKYEKERKGFSIVVARNKKGRDILEAMINDNLISCNSISIEDTMDMHGHMFDFKKRGAFIRMRFRKFFFKAIPEYGYEPVGISMGRKLVELFIAVVFLIAQNRISRTLVTYIPINFIGTIFNKLRMGWKTVSKPTKRKGLGKQAFKLTR